jgi:hypothetical protein
MRPRTTRLLLALALLPSVAAASSSGITQKSGNPARVAGNGASCSSCHSGGAKPTVTLQGPATLAPGATGDYRLVIAGGQKNAGGLDVSSNRGTLIAGAGTRAKTYCYGVELTHLAPRSADATGAVTFDFQLQAPSDPDLTLRLYAAGNSVDLSGSPDGDQSELAVLDVVVGAGSPTPPLAACGGGDGGAAGDGGTAPGAVYDTDGGCLLCAADPVPQGGCSGGPAGLLALLPGLAWARTRSRRR